MDGIKRRRVGDPAAAPFLAVADASSRRPALVFRPDFPLALARRPPKMLVRGATSPAPNAKSRGCSSVVERHVANVAVVGSSPITRSRPAETPSTTAPL